MTTAIIVIIAVVFLYSYFKFKSKLRVRTNLAAFLLEKSRRKPGDVETMLSLASALTDAQQYKTAFDLYDSILGDSDMKATLSQVQLERVIKNKKFCDAPLVWSSGAKNHVIFRYLHYFFLNRIGRGRYNFIREEDVLEFNSMVRMNGGF